MTTKATPQRSRSKTSKTTPRKKAASTPVETRDPIAVEEKGLASVPDPSVAESYIGRTFSGRTEFEIFDAALKAKMNVLIEGPTGPGKTTACRAYSAARELPFYSIPSNVGIEPSQLFGKYIPDGDGGFAWIDGPVTNLVRHGGVLLINEVNFMPERVATVLFGLLDGRREITLLDHQGETIKAHDNLLVMADMNPGYNGTRPLNEAFRNRFSIQLFWGYDPEVEKRLIQSASLRQVMSDLRVQVDSGLYVTPVSTNMGMEFEAIAKALGLDFAISNFVTHFQVEERESITKVLEANRAKLEQDVPTRELTREELAERRLNMKPGDVDPEWGVYGEEWVWDDEDEMIEAEDN